MKTKVFITGLAFLAITSLGFSQNVPNQGRARCNQGSSSWVDANKDGVCDNYENRVPGQGKNANLNRGGKNQGKHVRGFINRPGQGRNFVDANNNGICDLLEGK